MHLAIAEARRRTKEIEPEYLLLEAWAKIAEGDRSAAMELQSGLDQFAETGVISAALDGYNYVLLGESASAARWLQYAYDVRDYNLVYPRSDRLLADRCRSPGEKGLDVFRPSRAVHRTEAKQQFPKVSSSQDR